MNLPVKGVFHLSLQSSDQVARSIASQYGQCVRVYNGRGYGGQHEETAGVPTQDYEDAGT